MCISDEIVYPHRNQFPLNSVTPARPPTSKTYSTHVNEPGVTNTGCRLGVSRLSLPKSPSRRLPGIFRIPAPRFAFTRRQQLPSVPWAHLSHQMLILPPGSPPSSRNSDFRGWGCSAVFSSSALFFCPILWPISPPSIH